MMILQTHLSNINVQWHMEYSNHRAQVFPFILIFRLLVNTRGEFQFKILLHLNYYYGHIIMSRYLASVVILRPHNNHKIVNNLFLSHYSALQEYMYRIHTQVLRYESDTVSDQLCHIVVSYLLCLEMVVSFMWSIDL